MSKSTNASKHAAAGVSAGVGSGVGRHAGAGSGVAAQSTAGAGPVSGVDSAVDLVRSNSPISGVAAGADPSAASAASHAAAGSAVDAAPVIAVSKLNVDLAGRRVLNDVTMSAAAGELVGLLGPNGAGKTTLLRSILHLIPTVSGSIAIGGDTSKNARKHIGYVPQRQQFAWDFPISVLDTVVLGRVKTIGWFRRPGERDYLAAIEALDRTDMTKFRDRPVGDLSGGQRQRVLVARALALQPTVLLLDEPFTGLDMPTQELLSELFATLASEGETLIMSTHDIAGAVSACSRIVLRGMAFIGDAVSHAVFPGLAVAFVVSGNLVVGGAIAGVTTAILVAVFSQNRRIKEDSIIGVIFVAAFALGIVVISLAPGYAGSLQSFLFGSITGIPNSDIAVVGITGFVILLVMFLLNKELVSISLDRDMAKASGLPVFALDLVLYVMVSLAVVISIQTIGNILLLALLVAPAATTRLLTDRLGVMMVLSPTIGALSAVIGMYFSWSFDSPTGGTIVLVVTAIFLVVWLFSPKQGLVGKAIARLTSKNSRQAAVEQA